MWTIDELAERVREALEAEYPGAPNARVRDVPDRRAIRWYTTIGLVDKPLGMRGRTALYGPRHLQQLVAIKRRQAEGHSLAQIQVEFTWLTPEALREMSRVPEWLLDGEPEQVPEGEARPRFWTERPTPAAAPRDGDGDGDTGWPHRPVEAAAPVRHTVATRALTEVSLGAGAVLLVPHAVSDRDRDAIAEAAAPLIELLAARGLTDGSPS